MIRTPSAILVRCQSPAQVERIARANRAPYTVNGYAASVTLSGVTYFWSAA